MPGHCWRATPNGCGQRSVWSPPTCAQNPNLPGGSDAVWLSEYGPEQTRPLRALRVWAALASTGQDGYRRLINHDLDLAELLAARISEHSAFSLEATGLSIVCFRYRTTPPGNRVQAQIARHIQLGGESFLTTTEIAGRTVLRACFLNPLTTEDHVNALPALVAAAGTAFTTGQALQ